MWGLVSFLSLFHLFFPVLFIVFNATFSALLHTGGTHLLSVIYLHFFCTNFSLFCFNPIHFSSSCTTTLISVGYLRIVRGIGFLFSNPSRFPHVVSPRLLILISTLISLFSFVPFLFCSIHLCLTHCSLFYSIHCIIFSSPLWNLFEFLLCQFFFVLFQPNSFFFLLYHITYLCWLSAYGSLNWFSFFQPISFSSRRFFSSSSYSHFYVNLIVFLRFPCVVSFRLLLIHSVSMLNFLLTFFCFIPIQFFALLFTSTYPYRLQVFSLFQIQFVLSFRFLLLSLLFWFFHSFHVSLLVNVLCFAPTHFFFLPLLYYLAPFSISFACSSLFHFLCKFFCFLKSIFYCPSLWFFHSFHVSFLVNVFCFALTHLLLLSSLLHLFLPFASFSAFLNPIRIVDRFILTLSFVFIILSLLVKT